VQAALAVRPPVGMTKNQIDVVGGRGVDARVLQDQRAAVEGEAGGERVRVRGDRDRAQAQRAQGGASGGPRGRRRHAAAVGRHAYRPGVVPNVLRNTATNALTLAYPLSDAALPTDSPSASRRTAKSRRARRRQSPTRMPVSDRNSRSIVRRLAPARRASAAIDDRSPGFACTASA